MSFSDMFAAFSDTNPPSKSRWEFKTLTDLENMPRPRWLVEDIVPEEGFSVLYGPSGAGKSFLALHYAMETARTRPVIYIVGEGAFGYPDRTKAWRRFHDVKDANILFCFDPIPTLNTREVDFFIEAAAVQKPVLIVLDTLARNLVGGDENSAKDMGLFIDACSRIQKGLKAAVLVLHHTVKTGRAERGSSALRGAADVMVELRNQNNTLTLKCSKTKDAEAFSPRSFQLQEIRFPDHATSCVVVPTTTPMDHRHHQPLRGNRKAVFEALQSFPEDGATVRMLREKTGLPNSTVQRAVNELAEAGRIVKSAKKGGRHRLTSQTTHT